MGHKPWRKIHFHEKVDGKMRLKEVWLYRINHGNVILKSPKGDIFFPFSEYLDKCIIKPSDIREWIEKHLGIYKVPKKKESVYFDIERVDFDKLYRHLLCIGKSIIDVNELCDFLQRERISTQLMLNVLDVLKELKMIDINDDTDDIMIEINPWSEVMT